MLSPHFIHLLNWHIFSLWQEEMHECSHNQHQSSKEEEIPALKWQSMSKNVCAVKKVNTKLTATVILCPADLISSGKISLGTNHANGPHE